MADPPSGVVVRRHNIRPMPGTSGHRLVLIRTKAAGDTAEEPPTRLGKTQLFLHSVQDPPGLASPVRKLKFRPESQVLVVRARQCSPKFGNSSKRVQTLQHLAKWPRVVTPRHVKAFP